MDPPGFTGEDRRIGLIVSSVGNVTGDDDDDADLQAALALSLQDHALHDLDHEMNKARALSQHRPVPQISNGEMRHPGQFAKNIDDDNDDDDLHAALALSLQMDQPHIRQPDKESHQLAIQSLVSLEKDFVEKCFQSKEPFDVGSFHRVMWDAAVSTDSDKERWVEQGIITREDDEDKLGPVEILDSDFDECKRLELLSRSHLPWGLVQQHGGPCGVLAAVQAEMLRYIVWGPMSCVSPASFLSRESIQEALARAIGMILARAALSGTVEMKESESSISPEVVRLVIPSHDICNRPLSWEDFEPWSTSTSTSLNFTSSNKKSNCFFSITIPASFIDRSVPKRQKTLDENTASHSDGEELVLQERIDRLGQTVAAFLLQSAESEQPPIHYFQNAGGVLLLVMSLIASRTGGALQKLEREFDDPVGTRLTAQFGHCSQELINLLLTGQGVSNVFDNTLKPSGDMICRGISSRPMIGYLSQLESLRYCQVGSYYKSPRFPIWVVGSTSHFTVLFGPHLSMQESQSDVLLEKCRRAFKAVEGGDENGFISTNQLAQVLSSLGLHQEGDKLNLLSAKLEINGAGIILWDDFWKTASRLLTGASLENIMASDDDPPPLLPITELPSSLASSTTNTSLQETDEEMARRLANEWGWEDSNSVDAVRGESPVELQLESDDGDACIDLQAFPESDVAQVEQDSKPRAKPKQLDFETYGNTFQLYHYNGLRGGLLTVFRVTRLTPEEAVGTSIALHRSAHSSASSADLEDVTRTKWPSCTVDWLGKSPPFID